MRKTLPESLLTGPVIAMLARMQTAPDPDKSTAAIRFNTAADRALRAMKQRAEELKLIGVGVVAWSDAVPVQSWTSKMMVVGQLASVTSKKDPAGENFLGIAYTKAAEMAETLRDSGSQVRPAKIGEYGYRGGLMARAKTGILFATFSGGPAEDDLKVARTGLDLLVADL